MKKAIVFYRWILIAVLFQFGVLFYLNNIFLNPNREVNITKLDNDKQTRVNTGDFKVDDNAEQIKMSFNGRFCAYLIDGELHITNVETKSDKKVVSNNKDKITYFKWLPDRDMVIYSTNTHNGTKGKIQISTYEADSETMRDYPLIEGLSSSSSIQDIELSPYTNIVYAQIKTSEKKSKLVSFNIMSQYSSIMTFSSDTIIKECTYVNKLFYNSPGQTMYVYDGNTKVKNKVSVDQKATVLLDVDDEDTLYVGKLDSNNMVASILKQKVTDKKLTQNWEEVKLVEGVAKENIIISKTGKIYINYKDENKIVNVENGLKASYRGEFIELLDGLLVSKDGNKVNVITLKEY